MLGAEEPVVRPLARLDLVRDDASWAFADAHRPAIDAHFARLAQANPNLWNGRVLLLAHHEIVGEALVGFYRETDFASFLWWRDSGFPDPAMRNCFAMGALRSADGAYLLGRMAGWTANAGKVYFAAGTPEPSDVTAGGTVDLAGSVLRELAEETGLTEAEITVAPGWHAVFAGPRIALMRPLVSPLDAEALAARICAHIASETRSELDGVVIARGPADLSEAMPAFIQAYLRAMWKVPESA